MISRLVVKLSPHYHYLSNNHDSHYAFRAVLHPCTLAPCSLHALCSAWTVAYFRSYHNGVECGEDKLYHSPPPQRPDKLQSSVLWYGPGLARLFHVIDCESFHIRPCGCRTLGDECSYNLVGGICVRPVFFVSAVCQLNVEYSARMIHNRLEYRFFSSFAAELIGLFIFFLLWLVGAAITTVSTPRVLPQLLTHGSLMRSTLATLRKSTFFGETSPRAGTTGSAAASRQCWPLLGLVGPSCSHCL